MTGTYGGVRHWLADHDPLTFMVDDDGFAGTNGHPVTSLYVEHYWLPIVGPSALWVLRRLQCGAGTHVTTLDVLSASVGLGVGTGTSSRIVEVLARLVAFHCARIDGDTLVVRSHLPWLTGRQWERLHPVLQVSHGAVAGMVTQ